MGIVGFFITNWVFSNQKTASTDELIQVYIPVRTRTWGTSGSKDLTGYEGYTSYKIIQMVHYEDLMRRITGRLHLSHPNRDKM